MTFRDMSAPLRATCLSLAMASTASLAVAADEAKPAPKKTQKAAKVQAAQPLVNLFRDLDTNSDKVIERSEIPETGRKAFDSLLKYADTNHDEKLQADEYKALVSKVDAHKPTTPEEREARFKKLDKNGDGKLELGEFSQADAQFKKLDKNHDNYLDRSELPWMNPDKPKAEGKKAVAKAEKKAAKVKPVPGPAKADDKAKAEAKPAAKDEAKPAEKPEKNDEKSAAVKKPAADSATIAKTGEGDSGKRRQALREKFKAMDKDGDGRVSRAEFAGRPNAFDRLDVNHDGYIDREDLKQARQAKAGKTDPKS